MRAVEIARQVEGPVKVVWTREEDIQHDMYRPYLVRPISAGLDEKGRPVAWKNRFAGSSIIARWSPPAFKNGLDPDIDGRRDRSCLTASRTCTSHIRGWSRQGIPTAFWRSVGPSHNVFVTESFMDELAAAAKQDPVAYRRALLDKSPRAKAVLDLAAEKSGWGQPLPKGVAAASPFSSCSAAIWRKLPRSRWQRTARFAFAASSAQWIAAPSSIPIPCRRRSERSHLRRNCGALWRDHAEERSCRADQLRHLSDDPYQRGPGDRGPHR